MSTTTSEEKTTTTKVGQTLAVIGCGTMGTAILQGVLDSCLKTQSTTTQTPRFTRFILTVSSASSASSLSSRFSKHASLVTITRDNLSAIKEADVILLAFKPYMIDSVLSDSKLLSLITDKLIISVLVGSPPEKIEGAIYKNHGFHRPALYIKRAMPNIGAMYGESMTVIESSPTPSYNVDPESEELTDWIFQQIGKIQHVTPELFDVGGVLAGASGALLSVAVDGMLDGAVSQGLKRSEAREILTQSLVSLATLLQNGEHPAVLREKFSSPRGTTIAGLLSLEEDRARWAYSRATIASSERSKEIGEVKK